MLYNLTYCGRIMHQFRISQEEAEVLNGVLPQTYQMEVATLLVPSNQKFRHGDPLLYNGKYAGFFRDGDERTMRIVNLYDTVMIVSREGYTKAESFPERIIDAAGNYLGLDIGDFQIQGESGRINRRTSDVAVPYNLLGRELFSSDGIGRSHVTEQGVTFVCLAGGLTIKLSSCKFKTKGGRVVSMHIQLT